MFWFVLGWFLHLLWLIVNYCYCDYCSELCWYSIIPYVILLSVFLLPLLIMFHYVIDYVSRILHSFLIYLRIAWSVLFWSSKVIRTCFLFENIIVRCLVSVNSIILLISYSHILNMVYECFILIIFLIIVSMTILIIVWFLLCFDNNSINYCSD